MQEEIIGLLHYDAHLGQHCIEPYVRTPLQIELLHAKRNSGLQADNLLPILGIGVSKNTVCSLSQ